MGGGLMQLVAYGAQDIYLTGNPQITFFKVVYRRHTNFAVESIEQTFNGSAEQGKKFSCTISRNGDLLHRVYLEVDLLKTLNNNNASAPSAKYGFNLINYVELEIGGQCIDKHYGEWMAIWVSLTHGGDGLSLLNKMMPTNVAGATAGTEKNYIPLQFWFCRNPGLALPLIALQYHEVKINVQFNASESDRVNNISNCCVFCDYIFLDTDERRRFAQVSHEYLIEQVQFSNKQSTTADQSTQTELRFNHPVKELVWVVADSTGTEVAPVYKGVNDALLQLNGHDRFKRRKGSYFNTVQRYQHHGGSSQISCMGTGLDKNTHLYSFALKPEEHQPSGTCNFSRIDNAVLNLHQAVAGSLSIYAVNYNVLRIMSGMGGLAYSN